MHCSRTFVRHADYKIIDKELGCSKRALYSCSAIYENDVWVETHLSILFQVFCLEFVPRYHVEKVMYNYSK